jgi:hypothetical protein
MTFKELSQLYWLNREIERDKKLLEELDVEPGYTPRNITGVPGTQSVADMTSKYATEIADLSEVIEINKRRCFRERNRLTRYINSVDDSRLRDILFLRFVSGLSWRQVAASIGGGNTAESVRKACKRLMKKNIKK